MLREPKHLGVTKMQKRIICNVKASYNDDANIFV
jgi:hypothetical protein